MPVLLEGAVRFPTSYAPWYVYKVTLVNSPAQFEYLDVLFPSSGLFDRLVSDDAVLVTGFCFALEKYDGEMTEVQVAIVGSSVPFVAGGTIEPLSLVSFKYSAGVQSCVAADATKFAAGKSMGRFRNHHDFPELLRQAVDTDIINILTGAS